MTPTVSRIQAVIDGPSDEDTEWYTAYQKKCEAVLSMTWFSARKKGSSHWVSAQEIGSTFTDTDPSLPTTAEAVEEFNKNISHFTNAAGLKRRYGNRPFKCPSCELRFVTKQQCKGHHDRLHKDTHEWQFPLPSLDPTHQPQPDLGSDEKGEEEGPAAETGVEDEEQAPIVRKRKRAGGD